MTITAAYTHVKWNIKGELSFESELFSKLMIFLLYEYILAPKEVEFI